MKNQVTRPEAIARFLAALAPEQSKDLAALYTRSMETQINVAQDGGQRAEGEFKGRKWHGWTDGLSTWKAFRIPYGANKEPHYDDAPMNFDIVEHAEGIGLSGWNWVDRVSKWCAYDFDSIIGHKAGLAESDLAQVREKAQAIPWVTVRKSTSGKGLHLYVLLPDVPTANHGEHAALARAVLAKLSLETGFDFESKVDVCGGNMWIWHRKQRGTDGLALIKRGETLTDIPANWRDHLGAVKGKAKGVAPRLLDACGLAPDALDELLGGIQNTPLDAEHKRLLAFLEDGKCVAWWDADRHLLVTHTAHLKEAHTVLKLKGLFETASTHSTAHNVFCAPKSNGAWIVRRFGQGVKEHALWVTDDSKWTKCVFNQEPDFDTACRAFKGMERPKGGYAFESALDATRALAALSVELVIPARTHGRNARLTEKDDRLIVQVERETKDNEKEMEGWTVERNFWSKVLNAPPCPKEEIGVEDKDGLFRHVISEGGENAGWLLKCGAAWHVEPLDHVKSALKTHGFTSWEAGLLIGWGTLNPWKFVNKPFQPEYTGNREWNRDAAQLRFTPSEKDMDDLQHPHWTSVLKHCGKALDGALSRSKWAQENGVVTGADYLKCWIASLFQCPMEPLPYLFLYGPQNTGKSTLHEALALLMKNGYARADNALINPQGFNGELASKVLCVVEEIDLRKAGATAYNRIKDWVTGRTLPIHVKGQTPFVIPNSTKWIQTANDPNACPVFSGDTRITMSHVEPLPDSERIPKRDLFVLLESEAPDFLRGVLSLELPKSDDRLNVPVIETSDKQAAMENNETPLQAFIKENCFFVPGAAVKFGDFYERFLNWISPDVREKWTDKRIGREIPPPYIKGRMPRDGQFHIGNMSWTVGNGTEKARYVRHEDKLRLEDDKAA
ncbi:MAG: primase-helicase family protein [Planctomycetota bacterium]